MAKKTKDENIEARALTTFDIANELAHITQKIVEQDGELQDGDFEALKTWQAAIENKAENIGHLKSRLDSEAAYFKAIEEAAKKRRKARENAVERLREYLASCMVAAGAKSIKKTDGLFSVSLVEGKTSVRIDNKDLLPHDLVEIVEVVSPKTDAIKAQLESGKEVPGAHLEIGQPYVQIR